MISPGIWDESKALGVGRGKNLADDRVPGDDGRHLRRLVGRRHVGIGRIDDFHVLLSEFRAVESPREQIVRHGKFDKIDLLPLDIGELGFVLEDHRVIAVREIAHDHCGRIDAASGGNRKRVHIGDGHRVEPASGILVDRFDVVVELLHVDGNAVFVGPLLHDARIGGVAPGHPTDIDRPSDLKALLLFGRSTANAKSKHGARDNHSFQQRFDSHMPDPLRELMRDRQGPSLCQSLGKRGLPGFCPAVRPKGCLPLREAALGPVASCEAGTLAANSSKR